MPTLHDTPTEQESRQRLLLTPSKMTEATTLKTSDMTTEVVLIYGAPCTVNEYLIIVVVIVFL